MKKEDSDKDKPSVASFKVGAIALAFLVVGYQAALFVTRASRLRLEANRDRPDTVYVYGGSYDGAEVMSDSGVASPDRSQQAGLSSNPLHPLSGGNSPSGRLRKSDELPRGWQTVRRNAQHSAYVESYRRETRRVESFRFNPNTVSVEDLQRLGFSEKQAQAIDNYRAKGGRFRRKADFAKSFVVADSVYRRLERYIDIPRVDLNRADSAALDELPGIGPWFATKILEYRDELGGYSCPEQLMDIYRFDQEKFDGLSDLVYCSPPEPYPLWTLSAEALLKHPYITSRQEARAIVLFRENTPPEGCTVEALAAAGILPADRAAKLARCRIANP